MRILKGSEVSEILRDLNPQNARRLLDALSTGLASYTTQKKNNDQSTMIHQPLRTIIQTCEQNTALIMPVSDTSTTVVKVATVPRTGDIKGAITIYSSVGELLGLLNAAEITAFRTALATMTVLTRWTPPPGKLSMVVFGAGKQAEWHVRLALLLVPRVENVTIINRSLERLHTFEQTTLAALKQAYGDVKFNTRSPTGNPDYLPEIEDALKESDIICCCTPSTEPLFTAKDLRTTTTKTRFLSLIGSYKSEMQEVDSETLRLQGRIFVDSKEACLKEAGELISAGIPPNDLTEIGEVFAHESEEMPKFGAQSEITIFKCVGLAIMDLIIAKALLDMAAESGAGTVLEAF